MDKNTQTKKERLIAIIESTDNDNVLDYLLMYIALLIERWG
jgi:hypothetical protein